MQSLIWAAFIIFDSPDQLLTLLCLLRVNIGDRICIIWIGEPPDRLLGALTRQAPFLHLSLVLSRAPIFDALVGFLP